MTVACMTVARLPGLPVGTAKIAGFTTGAMPYNSTSTFCLELGHFRKRWPPTS